MLASIAEQGIRDPLEGVDSNGERILLNGFKRYRCARKLGLQTLPYASLGGDEAMGIIQLLRSSNSKSLSILEQAKLIGDLKKTHKMAAAEIAEKLERSKGWVSMRTGLIGEMSTNVREKIFSGKFPVYAYMYTIRQFIRMNCAGREEVDEFVNLTAGQRLSIREIEQLAHGYFRGPEEFRTQIRSGNLAWGLSRMKEAGQNSRDCNEFEQGLIKDLEITQKYMQKVVFKKDVPKLESNSFFAQANLLTGGILRQMDVFLNAVRELHDRSGKA